MQPPLLCLLLGTLSPLGADIIYVWPLSHPHSLSDSELKETLLFVKHVCFNKTVVDITTDPRCLWHDSGSREMRDPKEHGKLCQNYIVHIGPIG